MNPWLWFIVNMILYVACWFLAPGYITFFVTMVFMIWGWIAFARAFPHAFFFVLGFMRGWMR